MKLCQYLSILFLITLATSQTSAQKTDHDFRNDFQYNITEVLDEINIDGKLDEATWQQTEIGTDFWQKVPFFAEGADPKTEVRLAYDDNNLYVAAKCYQTADIVIQSLKRDQYWDNTGIAIVLDPLNSKTNSVLFGTSAVGVQWDAVRTETSGTSSDWSNKWYVETEITDQYWSAEFAIPFKILRYDPSITEWGMNFVRNVQYLNQFHNWTAVPESFWPPNPAFAGALIWDKPPSKKSGNYNLIPYVTTRVFREKDEPTQTDIDLGLDAKIALNAKLNLDLTFNPDFSQVEVDELVTNLTRFNISLPEKRTFFLENADLFADFGIGPIRPFFSRTIGLDENFQPLPILYGARLTGNLTQNTRIGFMNVHSQSTDVATGQNQTAVSVKQQFGRSFIQGMFLNRQAFDGTETITNDYGRNASIEGLLTSDNGQRSVWGGLHKSFKNGIEDNSSFYNYGAEFRNANWQILSDMVMLQENYFADMGFIARVENFDAENDTIVRVGFNQWYSTIDRRIRPKEGNIQQHHFGFENLLVFNPDWSFNERYNRLRYFLSLKSNEQFRIRINYSDLDLLFPFSFTDATPFPRGRYKNFDINLEFESDDRKAFTYSISGQTGGFYNGRLTKFNIDANYRIQPWGNFGLGYQWNDLAFPDA